jgi:cardiolipin synthase
MSTIGGSGGVTGPGTNDIPSGAYPAAAPPPAEPAPAPAKSPSLLSRAESLVGRAEKTVVGVVKHAPAPAAPIPTTPEGKAAAIQKLISGTSGAVATLHSLLPGQKSLTDQVLDILKTCNGSAELDAVITKVGRRNLLLGLHMHGAHGDPVKDYISQVRASDVKPGDWNAYNKYMDTVTGTKAQPGNKVTLLNNGETAFPAIFAAIDGAKSSVNVETFEFHDDSTGQEYAKHLIDAAKRGVKINVMMDAHGSDQYGGQKMAALLRANGINVIESPTDRLVSKIDHRKVVVVDGSTGFTGGMNIGDDYHLHWHDMHSKIEGPAAADLQKAFLTRWKDEGGTVPPDVDYFPPVKAQGDQSVRVVPHTGGQDENLRMAYLRAIDTAQTSIKIEDPYFVDSEICDHLAKAAKRGVNVQCVWPATNDMEVEQTDEHARLPDLIAAGVHCYEYAGRPMAHEKVCTIDGKFSTIGSSNLDMRSLRNNNEINAVVLDPKFAGDLGSAIDADIAQAKPITSASQIKDSTKRHAMQLPLHLQALEDEL